MKFRSVVRRILKLHICQKVGREGCLASNQGWLLYLHSIPGADPSQMWCLRLPTGLFTMSEAQYQEIDEVYVFHGRILKFLNWERVVFRRTAGSLTKFGCLFFIRLSKRAHLWCFGAATSAGPTFSQFASVSFLYQCIDIEMHLNNCDLGWRWIKNYPGPPLIHSRAWKSGDRLISCSSVTSSDRL